MVTLFILAPKGFARFLRFAQDGMTPPRVEPSLLAPRSSHLDPTSQAPHPSPQNSQNSPMNPISVLSS